MVDINNKLDDFEERNTEDDSFEFSSLSDDSLSSDVVSGDVGGGDVGGVVGSQLFAASGSDLSSSAPATDGLLLDTVTRSGDDMVIKLKDGSEEIIEGYFSDNFSQETIEIVGREFSIGEFRALLFSFQDDVLAVPVGEVTSLEGGEAFAVDVFGFERPLGIGDDLFFGEELVLGELASMSVVMNDDSVFSLSSGARMVIDSHVFDEGAEDNNGSLLSIIKGTLLYISGKVAQQGYDNVGLVTPTGTIGIRGTSLIASVEGDGMDITLMSGAISFKSEDKTHILDEPFASLDISDKGVSQGKSDPKSVTSKYAKLFATLDKDSVNRVLDEMKEQGYDPIQIKTLAEEALKSSEETDSSAESSSSSDDGSVTDSVLDASDEEAGADSEETDEDDAESETPIIEVRQQALINKDSSGDFAPPLIPKASLIDDTGDISNVSNVSNDLITRDPRLEYEVEPLSELIIFDSRGNEVFRQKSGEDGKLLFDPGALADGEHSYRARSIDDSKNESELSAPFTFILDKTAPDAPLSSSIVLSEGPEAAIANRVTSDKQPTFEIKVAESEAEGTIYLVRDGKDIGSATIDKDGKAIVKVNSEQPEGDGRYVFYVVDKAGNRSSNTEIIVKHDYTPPVAPDAFELVVNKNNSKEQLTNDPRPKFIIKNPEEEATVEILDENGNVVSDPNSIERKQESGNKFIIFSLFEGLEMGKEGEDEIVNLQLKLTDIAGNSKIYSGYSFQIDRKPPNAPNIELVEEDGNNDKIVNKNPKFNFTGLEAGASLNIFPTKGGKRGDGFGSVDVPSSGQLNWDGLTKLSTLEEGRHTIEVSQTDQAGNEGVKSVFEFTIDLTPPVIESDSLTFVESDKSIRDYTVLERPPLLIKGEIGAKAKVEVGGQTVEGTIGKDGTLQLNLNSDIGTNGKVGGVDFKLTLTDPSGNEDSQTFTLTVDRKAPDALDTNLGIYESDAFVDRADTGDGIVSGGDGSSPIYVKVGNLTDDGGKVEFVMTDSDGNEVVITSSFSTTKGGDYKKDTKISGGELYAKITPVSNSGWKHGDHKLSYYVVDKYGVSGTQSAPKTIGIDRHDPQAPTISVDGVTVVANKYVNKSQYQVKLQVPALDTDSNEEEYASIKVYRKLSSDSKWGKPINEYTDLKVFTKVGNNYELLISQDLADEEYDYKVEVEDKSGRKAETDLEIIVDTKSPPAPTVSPQADNKYVSGTYYVRSDKSKVDYTIPSGEANPSRIEIKVYKKGLLGAESESFAITEDIASGDIGKTFSIYLSKDGSDKGVGLGRGSYRVEVKYFDKAGFSSSSELNIVQDLHDPQAPTISVEGVTVVANKYVNKSQYKVKLQVPALDTDGNEEEYASIKVYRKLSSDSAWGNPINEYADFTGFTKVGDIYVLLIDQNLVDEEYDYKVEVEDKSGRKAKTDLEIIVDTKSPPSPTISSQAGNEHAGTYYISSNKSKIDYTIPSGEANPSRIEITVYTQNKLGVESKSFAITKDIASGDIGKTFSIYLSKDGSDATLALGEGSYRVEVKYYDKAGLSSSSELRVVQDVTKPNDLSLSFDTSKVYSIKSLPDFNIGNHEAGTKLYYSIEDKVGSKTVANTGSGSDSVSGLKQEIKAAIKTLKAGVSEREVILKIWQVDKAGNVGDEKQINFQFDTEVPKGSVSQSESTIKSDGSLDYTVSKENSDTQYKIWLDVKDVSSKGDTLYAYLDGNKIAVTFHYFDGLISKALGSGTDYTKYNGKSIYALVDVNSDLTKLVFAFEDDASHIGKKSVAIDGAAPSGPTINNDLFNLAATTTNNRYADMKFNQPSLSGNKYDDVKYVKLVLEHPIAHTGDTKSVLYVTKSEFATLRTFEDVIGKFSILSKKTGADEHKYNLRIALVDKYGNESSLSDKSKGDVTIDLKPPVQPTNLEALAVEGKEGDLYIVKRSDTFNVKFETSEDAKKVVIEYSTDGTNYLNTLSFNSLSEVSGTAGTGNKIFSVAITGLQQALMLPTSGSVLEQDFYIRVKSITDKAGNKQDYSGRGDVIRVKLDGKSPILPSMKDVAGSNTYFDASTLHVSEGQSPEVTITFDKNFGEKVQLAFYLGTTTSGASLAWSGTLKDTSSTIKYTLPSSIPAGAKLYVKARDLAGNESGWLELFKVKEQKPISSDGKGGIKDANINVAKAEGNVKEGAFSFAFEPSNELKGTIKDVTLVAGGVGTTLTYDSKSGNWNYSDKLTRTGLDALTRDYKITITDKFNNKQVLNYSVTLYQVMKLTLGSSSLVADTGGKNDDSVTSDSDVKVSYTKGAQDSYDGSVYIRVKVTYDDLETSTTGLTKTFYVKYTEVSKLGNTGEMIIDLTGAVYDVTGGTLSSTKSIKINGKYLKFTDIELKGLYIGNTASVLSSTTIDVSATAKVKGFTYDTIAPDARGSDGDISLKDIAADIGSGGIPAGIIQAWVEGGESSLRGKDYIDFDSQGSIKFVRDTVNNEIVYTMNEGDAKDLISLSLFEAGTPGSGGIQKRDVKKVVEKGSKVNMSIRLDTFFKELKDGAGGYSFAVNANSEKSDIREVSGIDYIGITKADLKNKDLEIKLTATDKAGNQKIVKVIFKQWTKVTVSVDDSSSEDSFAYSKETPEDEASAPVLSEDRSPEFKEGFSDFEALSIVSPLDDDPSAPTGGEAF